MQLSRMQLRMLPLWRCVVVTHRWPNSACRKSAAHDGGPLSSILCRPAKVRGPVSAPPSLPPPQLSKNHQALLCKTTTACRPRQWQLNQLGRAVTRNSMHRPLYRVLICCYRRAWSGLPDQRSLTRAWHAELRLSDLLTFQQDFSSVNGKWVPSAH